MEPFLRAMRRRLERDRNRVHAYHDDLRSASLKRLAALARADGERAEADRRRETLRVEAIEREYRAKLDDLRRNYALRVTVEWVQALDLYVPVQRFEVLIRRRKGERVVRLDWHPLVRDGRATVVRGGPRPRSRAPRVRRQAAPDRPRRPSALRRHAASRSAARASRRPARAAGRRIE